MFFQRSLIAVFLFFSTVLALNGAEGEPPRSLQLARATFTKITLRWQAPDSATQVANYRVFRDGREIASPAGLEFTDENLSPGTLYRYSVAAVSVGGAVSSLSAEEPCRTMTRHAYADHGLVEQAVDSLHHVSLREATAISLLNAVRSALEALSGNTISFSALDSAVIAEAVTAELEQMKIEEPAMTDEQRQVARTELNAILKDSYNDNSFEDMYIHGMLIELADRHRAKGQRNAARLLFDVALHYLNNCEEPVQSTLMQLASLAREKILPESAPAEVAEALDEGRRSMLRFYDFFPESRSQTAIQSSRLPANWYFAQFPRLLAYDTYDTDAFTKALALVEHARELSGNDSKLEVLYDRIAAWELIDWEVRFADASGNPRRAVLTVTNISAEAGRGNLFWDGQLQDDERTFQIDGKGVIPLYNGHVYRISASVEVAGGNALNLTLPQVTAVKGKKLACDTREILPTESVAADGKANGDFIVATQDFAYNLRFTRDIDVFSLTWDWVDSEAFKAASFKVYNNGTVVAESTKNSVSRLPLAAKSGSFDYTVVAFDAAGRASRTSGVIRVMPGDQAPYADFFAWLGQYFEPGTTLSCDDPDGDGVDNYQEFLNCSDPTKAPTPAPVCAQATYTKLTLRWNAPDALPAGSLWEVRRNGKAIASVEKPEFTDSGLNPGLEYQYQIRLNAPRGGSDWSIPILFHTMRAETGDYAVQLQQVVDLFNPLELGAHTGQSLTGAVKSALESLMGGAITFSVIDETLLHRMVDEELALLREVSPTLPEAERLVLRDELQTMLAECFGGTSFEHLYIHTKLCELAEAHWAEFIADRSRTPRKRAAELLLDASLPFIKAHELSVYNAIARRAALPLLALAENATAAETKTALFEARDIWMRYFDFFEDTSELVLQQHPRHMIAAGFFRYFPVLLKYDSYDRESFEAARQTIDSLLGRSGSAVVKKLQRKIAAWELAPLEITVSGESGRSGTLTIRNVSERLAVPLYAFESSEGGDVRTFELRPGTFSVPVYTGHLYEITVTQSVPGGNDWVQTPAALMFPADRKAIFRPFDGGMQFESSTGGKLDLTLEHPRAPYNLRAEKLPDVFALQWDWTAPEGFALAGFRVYRGDELIGSPVTPVLNGIPRVLHEDNVYSYSVAAIGTDGVETRRSPALTVLPDFTPEEQRYFEWKRRYFGDTPSQASDDPDGDGLTNYQEFLLDSHPLLAPPETPDAITRLPGVRTAYYDGKWTRMPDFAKQESFLREIRSGFCFPARTAEILGSGKEAEVGLVAEGYFDVPETGYYAFFLTNDDGCVVSIDGVRALENNRTSSPQEYMARIRLNAGVHSFKVEYFNYQGSGRLLLDWSGESFSRRAFDADNLLWHLDAESAELTEWLRFQRDSDGDGLTDAEELKLGTDRFLRDSDNDGLSDGDEVYRHHTDPKKSDSNGNGINDHDELLLFGKDPVADLGLIGFSELIRLTGAEASGTRGNWQVAGTTLRCADRRGFAEYRFELTEPGIVKLDFDLRNLLGAQQLNLDFEVDGVFLNTRQPDFPASGMLTLSVYTPYLAAGAHTVRLSLDTWRPWAAMAVEAVKVSRAGLSEAEGGVAELQRQLLTRRNMLPEITTSRTSPVNLRGRAMYPGLVKLDGDIAVRPFGDGEWCADVPLAADAPTTVGIGFENGGLALTRDLVWQETDVVRETGTTLEIRKGDALKLTVAGGAWTVTGEGIALSGGDGECAVYRFDQAGSYRLRGECAVADGEKRTGEITVNVVGYQFSRREVACWLGWMREWQVPALPAAARLRFDGRLRSAELSGESSHVKVFADDNQPRYVAATLGENGPVLDVQQISGLGIYSSHLTGVVKLETQEDGTALCEMTIVSSPVRADTELKMNIFVAGVVFDDGTVSRTLRAADFDANGVAKVRFLRHPEATSSVCHNLSAYQNGEYMGVRTR